MFVWYPVGMRNDADATAATVIGAGLPTPNKTRHISMFIDAPGHHLSSGVTCGVRTALYGILHSSLSRRDRLRSGEVAALGKKFD
jgi:hypothetical protein